MIDYDDPAVEEEWCAKQRDIVTSYLRSEGVETGEIGEWPAFHVAPILAIFAIESKQHPGSVGWWVICGDLPTDYCSSKDIHDPRQAMNSFADRWLELSEKMQQGVPHPDIKMGKPEDWPKLAPMLHSRASTLKEIVADEETWEFMYED